MYGVSIPDNTIVAAGSVVTKSFEKSNIIIGGNPAKEIGDWEIFKQKTADSVFKLHGIKGKNAQRIVEEQSDKLISRKRE